MDSVANMIKWIFQKINDNDWQEYYKECLDLIYVKTITLKEYPIVFNDYIQMMERNV